MAPAWCVRKAGGGESCCSPGICLSYLFAVCHHHVSVVQLLLVATLSVSCVKKEMGEGSHSPELVWTVTTCVVTVWTTWNTC